MTDSGEGVEPVWAWCRGLQRHWHGRASSPKRAGGVTSQASIQPSVSGRIVADAKPHSKVVACVEAGACGAQASGVYRVRAR
jgi:hypothetical protein